MHTQVSITPPGHTATLLATVYLAEKRGISTPPHSPCSTRSNPDLCPLPASGETGNKASNPRLSDKPRRLGNSCARRGSQNGACWRTMWGFWGRTLRQVAPSSANLDLSLYYGGTLNGVCSRCRPSVPGALPWPHETGLQSFLSLVSNMQLQPTMIHVLSPYAVTAWQTHSGSARLECKAAAKSHPDGQEMPSW